MDDKVGFVCNSRVRIAESRSESVAPAPCILVPPVMLTLVLAGAGEDVLEGFFEEGRKSEINGPEADGGGFEDAGTGDARGEGWEVAPTPKPPLVALGV